MEPFKIVMSKHILSVFDKLISELEEKYTQDQELLKTFDPILTVEQEERIRQARENFRNLEIAKAEREDWLERHPFLNAS